MDEILSYPVDVTFTVRSEAEMDKLTALAAELDIVLSPAVSTTSEAPPLTPAQVWVGGVKQQEGSVDDMKRRFDQETAQHKASVSLKVWNNGVWAEKLVRRRVRAPA